MPPLLQLDSKTILFLLLFGLAYGIAVQESRQRAPASRPFLFMWVMGGVAATVLIVTDTIGWAATITLAAAFALTGLPVTLVTIYYFVREIEKAKKRHRLEHPDMPWPGSET